MTTALIFATAALIGASIACIVAANLIPPPAPFFGELGRDPDRPDAG